MSKRMRLGILVLALVVSFAAGKPATAVCINSVDTQMTCDDYGGDCYCGGYGGGCSSCFTSGTRGEGSWDLCYYDWATNDLDCTYWN